MCARAVSVNPTKSRLFLTGEGSARRRRLVCEFLFAGNIEQSTIRVNVVAHDETNRIYAPVNNPNNDKRYDANTDKTKVRIAFTRLPQSIRNENELTGDQLMWMVDEEKGNDDGGILDSSDFTFNFQIVGEPGMSTTPKTPITNDDFDPCDL